MARGGKCRKGGAVKPVSLLQAGRAGLLHCCLQLGYGNGWVKSSLDGCQRGMVPRCGEQAAVRAAETCHKLLVGISASLVCSSLMVFGSWGFFSLFPQLQKLCWLMGKGTKSPCESAACCKHSIQELGRIAPCARSVWSVSPVSAAQLTPSSCTFCTWAGSPQNGELRAQLPLKACLCLPTILSHPAGRTEQLQAWAPGELCCFASTPLGIIPSGLKGS